MEIYESALPDIEAALPALAEDIGADYPTGTYEALEDRFHAKRETAATWSLSGRDGIRIEVKLERWEGYYPIVIHGSGARFQKAKKTLYRFFQQQGGNPLHQEKP